jgi:hypothetical protein
MKANLLDPERSHYRTRKELQPLERDLAEDLELAPVLEAMAAGDDFVRAAARTVLLSVAASPEAVEHRQQVLADFLAAPHLAEDLYRLAAEALEAEKHVYHSIFDRYPDAVLRRSIESLNLLAGMLRRLRALADAHAPRVRSPGLKAFFATVRTELDEEFFISAAAHLKELKFRDGLLASAQLGQGLKGAGYTLRTPGQREPWWRRALEALFPRSDPHSFRIPDRDEGGHRALSELADRVKTDAANALAQADAHIVAFFEDLNTEAAFYLGCLNLHAALERLGHRTCFPSLAAQPAQLSFQGLYDPSLALRRRGTVVGNSLDAGPVRLVVVTGANEGGKSTFLRSIGLAQLMSQAGMFVAADAFRTSSAPTVLTHFARAEDAALRSGKFDEELVRMGELAGRIRPGSLVLFNESFASTNEREGSEVAAQILRALIEAGTRCVAVTHMYTLSNGLYRQGLDGAVFLRAERAPDGQRTYRLVPGAPETTSYGQDLYREVFGDQAVAGTAAGSPGRGEEAQ